MKLVVDGMTCAHCVRAITGAIQRLDPAAVVDVRLDSGEVAIAGQLVPEAAVRAIVDAGYVVVGMLEDDVAAQAPAKAGCCASGGPGKAGA